MIIVVSMLCGITLFVKYLVVVGVKVSHVFCFIARLCLSYLIDQRIILFWKKALICDNNVVRTLASISRCSIGLTLSKYHIPCINVSAQVIKDRMWTHFVDVACDRGQVLFC